MKIAKFSIVRRKSVAVLLTVCVLAATFVGIMPTVVSAATLATIGNHAIGSDDFETNKLSSDWQQVATSGFNANVTGGKLALSHTNSSGSSFKAMLLRKEKAVNQRVRLDWVIQGDINPEVWARVQTDSTGKVTGGYFVRFVSQTANSNSAVNNTYAMLYKLTTENGTRKVTTLAKLGTVNYDKDQLASVELVVTGTNPTVVTAVMYKNNSFAHKNVVVDSSEQLQQTGTAGITYQKANGKTVADAFSADNFEFTTTDNEKGEYYQSGQQGSPWHDATTSSRFAQVLVLDPSKTYVLEAIGSTSNTKNIFADYENNDGASTSFFADDELPMVTVSDDGYNLYRYELNFPANAKRNSSFYHSENGQNVNYTRVRVGYSRGSSDEMKNAVADFTRFTVYEKDDPKKTNLLVNGDFKMGFYGWFNIGTGTGNMYQFRSGFNEGTTSGFTGSRAVINVFDDAAKAAFKSKINVSDKDKLAYLNNTYYNLTSLKKLNISYIGGSVTSGYGSSDNTTKSWRALTTAWFNEKFPDAEINANNAAIGGTGSFFGVFRYETDVQSYSPDLLFIEFAINDLYDKATKEQSIRNVESIIQNAYTRNANTDIVLVGVMDKWNQHDYANFLALKELAEKYKLMFIDIKSEFASYLATTGTNYETYFKENDGVHPNDTGYGVYAKIVTENLASDIILTEAQDVSARKHNIPATNLSSTDLMLDAQLIKADEISFETNSGFTFETKTFSSLGNRNYSKRYVASATGSTATFKFVGTDIGLLYAGKNNGGKLECSVDGGTPVVIDTYRAAANPLTAVIAENLANVEHTLTIKVLDEKNENSNGTNIEIGAILLNGTLPINPANQYMVHNVGTSENAQFGQIVDLKPDTEYNYSLYYKNISGNSTPAIWYIKSTDTTNTYKKLPENAYTSIIKGETNGDGVYYDAHYTFKLPEDAKVEGGVAKILVGYDSGSMGSDSYYYGFKLVEGNDSVNLLTNTDFKRGLYGWSSIGYNYIPDSTETASVTLKKDARLVKFDSLDFFRLNSIEGEIMLHITGEMDYSHITQFIKLEPNKTYRFQIRKKIILEASCKPYVWFKYDGKTEKNAWKAENLNPIETDIDTLTYLYEFTVPSNATVDDDGKVTGKIGLSTGSKGADVYYAEPKLWAVDDASQTNLFENADFKKGFKGWRIGGLGSEVLIENNGIFKVSGAELLKFDQSLFINDTTDNMFNDGDWYSKFGPDETYDDFIKRIYKFVGKKIPDMNTSKSDNPFLNVSTDMTSPDTGVNHTAETVAVSGVAILSLISLAFIYIRVRKTKKS